MITAFVMMDAERDRIAAIPDELLKINGVTEVYSIAGDFDLVAISASRKLKISPK